MAITSIDALISSLSGGKYYRSDFTKIYAATNVYAAGTVVAGRWYDFTGYGQNEYMHGNYIYNGHMTGGAGGWTLSSANLSWDAVNTSINKTGASSENFYQNTDCVNGTTYEVVYTIANYTGSGNITIALGGTTGTARTANGTFTENISCGATASAPCTVTIASTVSAVRIDNIIIRRLLAFTPYTDAAKGREAGIYHGGNVSTDTKHLLNAGMWTTAAVGAGAVAYIVDLLGCYPKIRTDLGTVQSLNNTLTIPRWTDGVGVRTFFTLNTANGTGANNFSYTYTNQAGTGSRTPSSTAVITASGVTGHMLHTGVAAGNYGPFLPMAGGDAGIRSIESVQFSAASGSAGFVDMVLCRPLATIPITTAFIAAERDFLTQLPSLPKIPDGAVLGLIIQAGGVIASGTQWQGYIETAWG